MKFIAVRYADPFGNVNYVRRYDETGAVRLLSSSLTPLALSNMGSRDTHLLEARLARCTTENALLATLRADMPRGNFSLVDIDVRRAAGDPVPARKVAKATRAA